ncbi:hypothetical protein ES708_33743 [subsurface metagenome]
MSCVNESMIGVINKSPTSANIITSAERIPKCMMGTKLERDMIAKPILNAAVVDRMGSSSERIHAKSAFCWFCTVFISVLYLLMK